MARKKSPPPPIPVIPLPPLGDPKTQILEVNFTELASKVDGFEIILEQSGAAMDGKLDIVLAEAKDFRDLVMEELRKLRDTVTQGQKEMGDKIHNVGERVKGAETHIEHLLREQDRKAGR